MSMKFPKQLLSYTLSFAIVSGLVSSSLLLPARAIAQTQEDSSKLFCSMMIKNESQQIEMLTSLKKDIVKSSKIRGVIGEASGIAETYNTADALGRAIENPSTLNVLDSMFGAIQAYLNFKSAKKERQDGKDRSMSLDDMIVVHKALVQKLQTERECSQELYIASIAHLLREQVTIQTTSLDALDGLISSVEKQKSTSAYVFTGIGAAGMIYTMLTWRNSYFLKTFFVGGLSLAFTVAGGFQIIVDQTTLRPILNDLKTARSQMAAERAQAVSKLETLAHAKIN